MRRRTMDPRKSHLYIRHVCESAGNPVNIKYLSSLPLSLSIILQLLARGSRQTPRNCADERRDLYHCSQRPTIRQICGRDRMQRRAVVRQELVRECRMTRSRGWKKWQVPAPGRGRGSGTTGRHGDAETRGADFLEDKSRAALARSGSIDLCAESIPLPSGSFVITIYLLCSDAPVLFSRFLRSPRCRPAMNYHCGVDCVVVSKGFLYRVASHHARQDERGIIGSL